ncbi:hypothetical protein, partial [Actinoplanes sp. NPDC051411]|uniref:hypothetical protein n=1 Tax=Actinoplanes sp. NPDC051411 TaxID=3155522 RepID=UPI00342B0200
RSTQSSLPDRSGREATAPPNHRHRLRARSAANEDVIHGTVRPCRTVFIAVAGTKPEATSSTVGATHSGISETDDEGWPIRQVEMYDAGQVLRYGPGHDTDRYGGLGQASLYDSDEDWSTFEITVTEFERVWRSDYA